MWRSAELPEILPEARMEKGAAPCMPKSPSLWTRNVCSGGAGTGSMGTWSWNNSRNNFSYMSGINSAARNIRCCKRRMNHFHPGRRITATLFTLVVLSLWICPSSTAVEAFVSLTAPPPTARRAGFRLRNSYTSRGTFDSTSRGKQHEKQKQKQQQQQQHEQQSPQIGPLLSVRDSNGSISTREQARRSRVPPCASSGAAAAAADAAAAAATSPAETGLDASTTTETVAAGSSPPSEPTEGKGLGKKDKRIRVETAAEMRKLLSDGKSLFELDARGASQELLEGREDEHPVLEALRKRAEARTKPGSHGDGLKVGLAIEGGGMRGCVSAGMIAAVSTLGLMDTFDAVYGSSAGSLVGAYAIAAQEGMPRMGCSVYYDTLTGTGRHFIDTRQIYRAMGLGLFGTVVTRWRGIKELVRQKMGSPVLKLDYLLRDVVEQQRPLNWEDFWTKQASQPLHVIASGVESQTSVVMSSKGGHFRTLRELTECMRASMLLPGITGPMVTLPNVHERLVDSQLYEPIPFQAALDDGCTHVMVIRSRPDGGNLLGKPKLPEKLITRRFFKRKHQDLESYAYMKRGGHKRLYAESVLTLNEAAKSKAGDAGPYLMPMSLPASEPEVGRLERRRESILEGVRKGYEHAHLLLRRTVPGHSTAGLSGREAALKAFPASILEDDVDPVVREILKRSSKHSVHGEGSGKTIPKP